MTNLYHFLSGAVMFAAFVAGSFFLKFWRTVRDRLFLYFAVACWLLAAERVVLLALGDPNQEKYALTYLIRLAAFGLILFAIGDKNRIRRRAS